MGLGSRHRGTHQRLHDLAEHDLLERLIFCEEIKGYSLSPEAIANYLKSSNETANEKERLLVLQREVLQRIKKEIRRTYDLYQQEKLDTKGFTKFYAPLEERRKQVETALPRLEAELDILRVNNLSAEEITTQASKPV
jgi:site-specific DNA recombinase